MRGGLALAAMSALFSVSSGAGAVSAERSGRRDLALEGDAPLGSHERRSTLAPLDVKRFDVLRKSCGRNDFAACASLGRYYDEGVATALDVARASEIFGAACTHGQQRGCVYWALQALRAGDDKRAFTLLLEACDKRDPLGCLELGLQYLADVVTPRDEVHAFELVERSCKSRYQEGCATLALFYDLGLGVAKSQTRALTLSGY
jgi:TPR repeat protein